MLNFSRRILLKKDVRKESPDKRKRSEHSSVSEPDIGKEDTKTQNSKEG